MKHEFIDILACPLCKNSLELMVVEETNNEVVSGSLNCSQCNQAYPIKDGIPNLLPPELQL